MIRSKLIKVCASGLSALLCTVAHAGPTAEPLRPTRVLRVRRALAKALLAEMNKNDFLLRGLGTGGGPSPQNVTIAVVSSLPVAGMALLTKRAFLKPKPPVPRRGLRRLGRGVKLVTLGTLTAALVYDGTMLWLQTIVGADVFERRRAELQDFVDRADYALMETHAR